MQGWSSLGALAAVVLQVGLVLGSLALLRLLQRWLGVRGFRWCSGRPAEGALFRRVLARGLSVAPAPLLGYALLAGSLVITGKPELTTEVKVLPGTNTGGYESWWRVDVPEVSASAKVNEAHAAAARNTAEAEARTYR